LRFSGANHQLAPASHQRYVGRIRVKKQINSRMAVSPNCRLALIASRFVVRVSETHKVDSTTINLLAREDQLAGTIRA
jgi:hypothetical protein